MRLLEASWGKFYEIPFHMASPRMQGKGSAGSLSSIFLILHVIGEGVAADEEKVSAVGPFPKPAEVTNHRSFFGTNRLSSPRQIKGSL